MAASGGADQVARVLDQLNEADSSATLAVGRRPRPGQAALAGGAPRRDQARPVALPRRSFAVASAPPERPSGVRDPGARWSGREAILPEEVPRRSLVCAIAGGVQPGEQGRD